MPAFQFGWAMVTEGGSARRHSVETPSVTIVEYDRSALRRPMERGILLAARDDGIRCPWQSNPQEVVGADFPRRHDLQAQLLDADPRMRGLHHAARRLVVHGRDPVRGPRCWRGNLTELHHEGGAVPPTATHRQPARAGWLIDGVAGTPGRPGAGSTWRRSSRCRCVRSGPWVDPGTDPVHRTMNVWVRRIWQAAADEFSLRRLFDTTLRRVIDG